jgi:hypothetical protein
VEGKRIEQRLTSGQLFINMGLQGFFEERSTLRNEEIAAGHITEIYSCNVKVVGSGLEFINVYELRVEVNSRASHRAQLLYLNYDGNIYILLLWY